MITIEFSSDVISRAEKIRVKKTLNNSIRKGKGNLIGAIGEVIVYDYYKKLGRTVIYRGLYDYDMLIDGFKTDVKTTETTVIPEDYFNCVIPASSKKQKTSIYVFVRINMKTRFAYIVGYINKKSFFEKAKFNKKGQTDAYGFKYRADTYVCQISQINKIE